MHHSLWRNEMWLKKNDNDQNKISFFFSTGKKDRRKREDFLPLFEISAWPHAEVRLKNMSKKPNLC